MVFVKPFSLNYVTQTSCNKEKTLRKNTKTTKLKRNIKENLNKFNHQNIKSKLNQFGNYSEVSFFILLTIIHNNYILTSQAKILVQ